MARTFLSLGSLFGLVSVVAGAFGSHILREQLPDEMLDTFTLATRYQMYHALALLALGSFWGRISIRSGCLAGYSFGAGTILFSGTLYVYSLTGERWWAMLTPIGGLALIAGWGFLLWACWFQYAEQKSL